ncbi:MAG: DUF5131 family protein, partial [Verrucomicrobiales bacterium]
RDELWGLIKETPRLDWLLLTKRPENFSRFLPADWGEGYPNVCLMVTAGLQEWAERRIPVLVETPARYRGISAEPLLGPIDFAPWIDRLNWIIVGGESGTSSRPMEPEWARGIRDICQETGTPFFFKQWGVWSPTPNPKREEHRCGNGEILHAKGGPLKGGNELDGRHHEEHPFEPAPCRLVAVS